jgi:membrane associated rhomboid family serine protease
VNGPLYFLFDPLFFGISNRTGESKRRKKTMYEQRDRRRRGGISPMVISLLFQIFQELGRTGYKPPVTIALLAVNILVHLHPAPYFFNIPLTDIGRNCINPRKIVEAFSYDKEILWNRLFLSSIIHADDIHLYYNMLSLLWKGINLETALGSTQFFYLVMFSLIVSHSLMVLMTYCLYHFFQFDGYSSGYTVCAVGFSAVLFSLKYVLNQRSAHIESVFGFPVPSKYAAWLELVLISVVTPNASFIGHLAGILAGVLYVHGPTQIIFMIPNLLEGFFSRSSSGSNGGRARTYGSGRATNNPNSSSNNSASNNHNNFDDYDEVIYVEELEEDIPPTTRTGANRQASARPATIYTDQIELEDEKDLPTNVSGQQSPSSSTPTSIDPNHVRSQRLNRFNQTWRR